MLSQRGSPADDGDDDGDDDDDDDDDYDEILKPDKSVKIQKKDYRQSTMWTGRWVNVSGEVKQSSHFEAAQGILRSNEWRRRNDISRKGGEYESAKWFEVGQNGIILTARPRALSRGILTRPEAGWGNESVTMHCIWNTACRTMHALCCISLPSFGHSMSVTHASNHMKVHLCPYSTGLWRKLQKYAILDVV